MGWLGYRWAALALGVASALGCAREGRLGYPEAPSAYDPRAVQSLRIPGGAQCLALLDRLGVKYQRLPPRGSMGTPVQITGDIGGVRYLQEGRPHLVCDCRL